METYIALLRGINVGGKNKISMTSLKAAFEEAGFSEVSTYINSGNIIFSSKTDTLEALQEKCQQIIVEEFRLDIAVAVLSAKELVDAIDHAPTWWDRDEKSKHNALFVVSPADAVSIVAAVGEPKPEYEQLAYYGQVIFWTAPLKTFSRTRWSKVNSTPVYKSITIRNANTSKKLAQIARPAPNCY